MLLENKEGCNVVCHRTKSSKTYRLNLAKKRINITKIRVGFKGSQDQALSPQCVFDNDQSIGKKQCKL